MPGVSVAGGLAKNCLTLACKSAGKKFLALTPLACAASEAALLVANCYRAQKTCKNSSSTDSEEKKELERERNTNIKESVLETTGATAGSLLGAAVEA